LELIVEGVKGAIM